jgi:hypothetical protein
MALFGPHREICVRLRAVTRLIRLNDIKFIRIHVMSRRLFCLLVLAGAFCVFRAPMAACSCVSGHHTEVFEQELLLTSVLKLDATRQTRIVIGNITMYGRKCKLAKYAQTGQ